ncbi:hypothetical protein [Demequina sp.]|uniref:hypothetical protein n=1 Tax=Demequina sp. TaxID=2050685 RepID=UPI003D11B699
MYTNDPVSLLSLHHVEHARLVQDATRASAKPASSIRASVSGAYYVAVRRAYLRARAARMRSIATTASRVAP